MWIPSKGGAHPAGVGGVVLLVRFSCPNSPLLAGSTPYAPPGLRFSSVFLFPAVAAPHPPAMPRHACKDSTAPLFANQGKSGGVEAQREEGLRGGRRRGANDKSKDNGVHQAQELLRSLLTMPASPMVGAFVGAHFFGCGRTKTVAERGETTDAQRGANPGAGSWVGGLFFWVSGCYCWLPACLLPPPLRVFFLHGVNRHQLHDLLCLAFPMTH